MRILLSSLLFFCSASFCMESSEKMPGWVRIQLVVRAKEGKKPLKLCVIGKRTGVSLLKKYIKDVTPELCETEFLFAQPETPKKKKNDSQDPLLDGSQKFSDVSKNIFSPLLSLEDLLLFDPDDCQKKNISLLGFFTC